MSMVALSETTYDLLRRRAREISRPADQIADEMLRQQLAPQHAHIEIVQKTGGSRAVIRDTRILVSTIIGYLQDGETPESLVNTILLGLNLAQIYDALSYYYDRRAEIDQELSENTEERGRAYLRERLGEEGYRRVTGQTK